MHFLKKSFEVNMTDPNDKLINYHCQALIMDKRDFELDLMKVINKMTSFMINELFTHEDNITLASDFLKFNENDKFSSKIYLVDDKIDSFSLEIYNKNITWPKSLRFKNFFLYRKKINKLKILDFLDSNVLNSTIYTFNPVSDSLISQNEIKNAYMNYTSSFLKNVTGSGLHQHANLEFSFEEEGLGETVFNIIFNKVCP